MESSSSSGQAIFEFIISITVLLALILIGHLQYSAAQKQMKEYRFKNPTSTERRAHVR
jgi:uncharacterized protein YneF (UPF0154 family)